MGKTVALAPRELAWARERFRSYYGVAVLEPPKALARREFAWFPFAADAAMRRHTGFDAPDAFKEAIRREAPRHVYYSSAYFDAPSAPTMASKGWLGADVIFDLDADHLRGAAGLSYPAQLALVRERVAALYDDFLRRDFGVDPSDLELVFSGGRGYHVHLRADGYLRLGSTERREIVDYVQGTGLDPRRFLVERRAAGDPPSEGAEEGGPRRARGPRRAFKRLPEPDAPGWAGRIGRSFRDTLARWEAGGPAAAVADLRRWDPSMSPQAASALARRLLEDGRSATIRSTGSLEVFASEVPPALLDVVLRQATIQVQGETDAPVTTDLHRLIRMPGSLHGGTGFRVVPMGRDRLDAFDPFVDALPFVGPGNEEVLLRAAVDYPFAEPVEGAEGDRRTLPAAEALFLVLRGDATLPPAPSP